MNRNLHDGVTELTGASRQRLADAEALLNASRGRGSMYMAGYAVECLLKTKLMYVYNCKNLRELEDLLRQRSILPAHRTVFTHQLEDLLRLIPGHNRLMRNRDIWHMFHEVNLWTPQWRYTAKQATPQEATRFLTFIENVMHWIDTNL